MSDKYFQPVSGFDLPRFAGVATFIAFATRGAQRSQNQRSQNRSGRRALG